MTTDIEKKFQLGNVIREAIGLYNNHFGILIKISFISMLLATLPNIMAIVDFSVMGSSGIIVLIVGSILSIVAMFYSLRLDISMMIAVDDIRFDDQVSDEENGVKEYYAKAKEFVWPYIGISILLGLVISIPMIMITSVSMNFFGLATRIVLFVLGLILFVIAYGKFQFVYLVRIFNPQNPEWFAASSSLVKGNFFKAAALVPIYYSIPVVISLLSSEVFSKSSSMLSSIIEIIIIFLLTLFFKPFQISLCVLSYRAFEKLQLKDNPINIAQVENQNQELNY